MIKKILVPLDGSELAESPFAYVGEFATALGVDQVNLVSVTERVQGFRALDDPGAPSGQRLMPEGTGKMERQATKYLKKIAKGLEAKNIKVTTEVLMGDPAQEISIYANTRGCDLIIMASHGRSGPSKWAHGSVADRVLRAVCVPVMIIRATGCTGNL